MYIDLHLLFYLDSISRLPCFDWRLLVCLSLSSLLLTLFHSPTSAKIDQINILKFGEHLHSVLHQIVFNDLPIHSFTHSFNKYLLITYYVSSTVLGMGDIEVNTISNILHGVFQ